ncbi:MAG: GFA family protein [Roseovarius sp.]|nr:GFA family protein [Roseovarius sp.]
MKSFCSDCGSALPISQPEIGSIVVPAGSLDSRIDMLPNAHICCSSRANWDNDLASIERIDGLPG